MRRPCSRKRRRSWAFIPSRCPPANLSQPYVNSLGVRDGRNAPIAASASVSAAPIIPRPAPQTTHSSGADEEVEFRSPHRMRSAEDQSSGPTARPPRASPMSTPRAANIEQPGDIILLCGYGLMNVRMMLLSGIGTALRSGHRQGHGGAQLLLPDPGPAARLFFEGKHFNPFIGSGALGSGHRRFQRRRLRSFGSWISWAARVSAAAPAMGGPSATAPRRRARRAGAPNGKRRRRRPIRTPWAFGAQGSSYPVRGNYLDLDPTYKDRHRPAAAARHLRFSRQ